METVQFSKNDDWTVHFSERCKRHYFFNVKTGESIWNKPIEVKKESPPRYTSICDSSSFLKPFYKRPLRKTLPKTFDLDKANEHRSALVNSYCSLDKDEENQIKHALDQTNEHQIALSNSYCSLDEDEERQIQAVIELTNKHAAFSKRFKEMENETNSKKGKRLRRKFKIEVQDFYYDSRIDDEKVYLEAKKHFYGQV